MSSDTIIQRAVEPLLQEHKGSTKAAAAAFADLIAKNATLRAAVARDVVERIAKMSKSKNVHSRRRVGPHRRHAKTPSKAQKAGALRAEQTFAEAIFERKLRGGVVLGNVRVHELRAIAEKTATTATSFLARGYDDAVEVIGLTMLSKHCVASDPFALLRDVIKPSVVPNTFERARIKAAEMIRDSSAKIARDLLAAGGQIEERVERVQ
jgi:hypothetical protein